MNKAYKKITSTIEVQEKEIAKQIKKIKTGLRDLEECIEVNVYNSKGLDVITHNLKEVVGKINFIAMKE